MKKQIILLFIFLSIFVIAKKSNVASIKKEVIPNYENENFWAALPWKPDAADSVPMHCSLPENQQSAKADVFYIYPTLYLFGNKSNADLENEKLNIEIQKCIKNQASAFNAAGKVYVPYYRQAKFKLNQSLRQVPFDTAYIDIRNAFITYLKKWNNGRPIILVGHSQGALLGGRLIKEFFDTTKLKSKLVAAYLIGHEFRKDEFANIPFSDKFNQTGCFITYNAYEWGTNASKLKTSILDKACTNPLSWTNDFDYKPATLNLGGLSTKKFEVIENVCDAWVREGILWINKPKKNCSVKLGNSYHVSELSLFYMNLRENAINRTENYK